MRTSSLTLLLTGLCALQAGCSIQRLVINKAGDALAGEGRAVARDDDPEFIRAAAPFNLKLIESLLEKSPRHEGMLLAAARGFTQYSYAYLQLDAEQLIDQDFARAQQLRQRAAHMYLRARDYGLRALEVHHSGVSAALRRDPPAALASTTSADVGALYWTALAWAAAIGQSKDDPQLVGDLPLVDALVARAVQLQPDYEHGALQAFLVSYEMARAARVPVAREHYTRAIADGGGRVAGPYVALAESVCIPERARAEFAALLTTALAIDVNADPDHRLETLIMQRRAAWLLARVDELFLPDNPPLALESAP
jgi:predicted anti-sigma-YlaC factor YlaD